jgi:hypothetical protein
MLEKIIFIILCTVILIVAEFIIFKMTLDKKISVHLECIFRCLFWSIHTRATMYLY